MRTNHHVLGLVSSFKSQNFIFPSHLQASNAVVNLLISIFLCKGTPVQKTSAFAFQEVPSIESDKEMPVRGIRCSTRKGQKQNDNQKGC